MRCHSSCAFEGFANIAVILSYTCVVGKTSARGRCPLGFPAAFQFGARKSARSCGIRFGAALRAPLRERYARNAAAMNTATSTTITISPILQARKPLFTMACASWGVAALLALETYTKATIPAGVHRNSRQMIA